MSGEREVPLHGAPGASFCNNVVSTQKYTLVTFLPKVLFEQLMRAVNAYFLFACLLMYLGNNTFMGKRLFIGTIAAWSTFGTLCAMMMVSIVMSAIDDIYRGKADREMNNRPTRRVDRESKEVKLIKWKDVQVGDWMVLKKWEDIPADIVVLASPNKEGNCYVSTANLDGESNLKHKAACTSTQCAEEYFDVETFIQDLAREPAGASDGVTAEAPTSSIHKFEGQLRRRETVEPLGQEQLLLRGSVLRNVAWCVGLVVYTGEETRVVKNARKTPTKQSNIEKVNNKAMLVVILMQAGMAAVSMLLFIHQEQRFLDLWYVYPTHKAAEVELPKWFAYWLTFFTLYSNLVPVSLYSTMEVCNFAQAFMIKSDPDMYDKSQGMPAAARSTNLCQELGQVSFVFSDKTGTLTKNIMTARHFYVEGFGVVDPGQALRDAAHREDVSNFLEVLSVAHTVSRQQDHSGNLRLEAESPDEEALVQAASEGGWNFMDRAGNELVLEVGDARTSRRRSYRILATNLFTSARKRMSVVAEHAGRHYLFIKGADTVMLDHAKVPSSKFVQQISAFAKQGLRTLLVGRRELDVRRAEQFMTEYREAKLAVVDREQRLSEVAASIERNYQILGISAIEDELQDDVGNTILKLKGAGIKLWILTGDMLETAKTIGFSTKVLYANDKIMRIFEVETIEKLPDVYGEIDRIREDEKAAVRNGQREEKKLALMITGRALENVMAERHQKYKFLNYSGKLDVVIACRVSPMQKAQLVQLVRRGLKPTPVTLAVGDGANDVPMIQEAQVGVGISGREGRQAVNSSDFAIGQFRFLQQLMLVQGRWNYKRTSKFILYTFWRNAVQVLLLFFYTFESCYSGTSLFEDLVRLTFNFILSWPIIAVGIFDRDISAFTAKKHPMLYKSGHRGADLNGKQMAKTLCSALVHSVLIWTIARAAFPGMDLNGAGDYYSWGTAVYSLLIIASNSRASFITITWTWYNVLAVLVSFGMYVMFLLWDCSRSSNTLRMYGMVYHMAGNIVFWLAALAVPSLGLSFDFLVEFLRKYFFDDDLDKVEKIDQLNDVHYAPYAGPTPGFRRASHRPHFDCYVYESDFCLSKLQHKRPKELQFIPREPESTDIKLKCEREKVKMYVNGVLKEEDLKYFTIDEKTRSFTCGGESGKFSHDEDLGDLVRMRDVIFSPKEFQFTKSDGAVVKLKIESGRIHGYVDDREVATNVKNFAIDAESRSFSSSSKDLSGEIRFGQDVAEIAKLRDKIFSPEACRSLHHIQMKHKTRTGVRPTRFIGALLCVLGCVSLYFTWTTGEVRVQYSGKGTEYCTDARNSECTAKDLDIVYDLDPPILVYAAIDPFYQNHNHYLKNSFAYKELVGTQATDADREKYCDPATLEDSGKEIVPCGLPATTLFNDTFTVSYGGKELQIEPTRIAWDADLQHLKNPTDDKSSSVSWLYERYPNVVKKADGVKSERFVTWMRVGALPFLRKPLGYISTPLTGGERLTINIKDNFNAGADARKFIVLTERSLLGGRNHNLGFLLIVGGVFASLVSCFIQVASNHQDSDMRKVYARESRPCSGATTSGLGEPLMQAV